MKKLIFFLLLLAVSACSFSQPTTTSISPVKIDYLKKSKHQKTIAWILAGGGLAIRATGYAIGVNVDFFDDSGVWGAIILLSTGAATMLASIPFFIASAKNKRRAMSLSFKNEKAP